MNKQSSIPDFDSVQALAKMAAYENELSLAKGGLLGAGLGTGLGYLKHRVGEYLSPSGSEYAPKLRSLQRQLGKPGKDQTQVKQQIARIQEQQDEARRSSRNRNLLGGALAGGSLGAYFEHVKQTNKNTARMALKALREQAFKSEQKAKATQEAKAKKEQNMAAWERSYKAQQETDARLHNLLNPGSNSTPAERSQKWFEQNNTPMPAPAKTPEPVKAVENEEKRIIDLERQDLANKEKWRKESLANEAYLEHQNRLIRDSMKRHRSVMALDDTIMVRNLLNPEGPVIPDGSLRLKGIEAMYGLEPGMMPSAEERIRGLRDDLIRTNEQATSKVLKGQVSSMKKKSSIQTLAKMAACGDTCRCGQTENECTCSDVEKLARLVAKQAGVFMKNMKEPNPIEVRTTDMGFMPVAEHYREPRLLAKPFYNQRREFQNALELLAMMQPEVMDKEKPDSNTAAQFGITLAMRYPDRYRLPADARAALYGPEPEKASRKKKANSCSCGCDNENECTCSDVEKLARLVAKQASGGAWTRAEGKSESGGLNAKGRASLKAQGQNIKPPVTEDKPTGERAGRKSSFCARMGGMKKKLTSSETANDPDSRINKALRKWNC